MFFYLPFHNHTLFNPDKHFITAVTEPVVTGTKILGANGI